MSARIAIIEDEAELAELISDYLLDSGFRTRVFSNGAQALAALRQDIPDFIVLDLMLPGLDGVSLCRAVREFSDVPVMMVTARVDEVDRLLGLETGADDYLCKPFSPRELVARVKAILRRPRHTQTSAVPIALDQAQLRASVRGLALDITPTEFRLLTSFMEHPGRVFSRQALLDASNPDNLDVNDRAIDSHIKNLRKKLGEFFPEHELIQSVYGVGYRFEWP